MGEMIRITAADGHSMDAYVARPEAEPRGGVVLVQEIFGVTPQMQRCADRFAAAGYMTIVPAVFDRIEPDLLYGYQDIEPAREAAMSLDDAAVMADMEAARKAVGEAGNVAIVGYCWGGTVSYMAAGNSGFGCAVSYYGSKVNLVMDRFRPVVPLMFHFGADDSLIPPATVEQIRHALPAAVFHVYENTGHGFCCDDRDGYDAESALLSEQRSLEFIARNHG